MRLTKKMRNNQVYIHEKKNSILFAVSVIIHQIVLTLVNPCVTTYLKNKHDLHDTIVDIQKQIIQRTKKKYKQLD